VLCNTQSELHPLEEGKHAAESGMDLKAYAAASGKNEKTLHTKVRGWRVLANLHVEIDKDSWRNLAEIHAARPWLWGALVERAPRARGGGSSVVADSPEPRMRAPRARVGGSVTLSHRPEIPEFPEYVPE
jgi:hypothetical protein